VVVVGYFVAAVVTVVILMRIAGRDFSFRRDRSVNLGEVASRHGGILASLAGFAITAIVLLVTFSRNIPDPSSIEFTSLLTMFFIAYVGFVSASLMFATISDSEPPQGFDVAAAKFVAAAVTLSFSLSIGWLAFRPLLLTFDLTAVADIIGIVIAVAVVVGCAQLAQYFYHAGIVDMRLAVTILLSAAAATALYGLLSVGLGLASANSTLVLSVTAFVVGAPGYVTVAFLPMLARGPRSSVVLTRIGPRLALAYAQAGTVLIGFLLLCVLGLA
jgi:hypothetical protein